MSLKSDLAQASISTGISWEDIAISSKNFHILGQIPFNDARQIQQDYVQRRIAGEVSDCVFLCEHPPTLSLGKRADRAGHDVDLAAWELAGADVVHCDRGGLATYHGPGQLVIYPVISLKESNLGPKTFICSVFKSIQSALDFVGIDCSVSLDPAGVWLKQGGKIAACGLKIERGVSNHGFSVNISTYLPPYRHFSPCGLSLPVGSLTQERACNEKTFVEKLCSILSDELTIPS